MLEFPVYGHTSLCYLKSICGYQAAKCGNHTQARIVAKKCVKPSLVKMIESLYPNAVILPVITSNKLPLALAECFKMKVCSSVKLAQSGRKAMSSAQRLLHKPAFSGGIQRGESYIIADDVVTQGGTIAELVKHVYAGGGKVVAVTALAFSKCGGEIMPHTSHTNKLAQKFGKPNLDKLLNDYRIAENIENLTNQQTIFLLKFSSINSIDQRLKSLNQTTSPTQTQKAA